MFGGVMLRLYPPPRVQQVLPVAWRYGRVAGAAVTAEVAYEAS